MSMIETENAAHLVPGALSLEEIEAGTARRRTGIVRTTIPEQPAQDNSLRARIARAFRNTFGGTTVVTELLDRIEAVEARLAELEAR